MPMPAPGQQQRPVGGVEYQVAEGGGDAQYVADADVVVQEGGDLAGRQVFVAALALHRYLADRRVRRRAQAVLPDLVGAVRQRHLDGHVLSGPERGRCGAVRRAQCERDDIRRLLVPVHDLPLAPDTAGHAATLGVQPGFQRDQRVGHQPVDLVPRLGDLGGDRVAEHLDDRGEQVLVHDLVLLGGDAQGRVLVRDPRQHGVRPGVRVLHQVCGEPGYGAGERLPLRAGGLVAPVEQVAQQLGVGGEHPGVEPLGDVPDGRADDRQGGLDGGGGLLGEQRDSCDDWHGPPSPVASGGCARTCRTL
jgi:hypothetical protein